MAPYDDLEQTYGASFDAQGVILTHQTIVLTSTKHKGAYNLRQMMKVVLTPEYVGISADGPFTFLYEPLRIPIEAIDGCGKTCFDPGTFDADLLLGKDGVEISVDKSKEVLEWCWRVGLPMITGEKKRNWMYKGQALPSKAGYVQVDKEEYERQTKSRCMGY